MSHHTDPLTIAYMAIGAKEVLRAHIDAGGSLSEHRFDGELDFFSTVVSHANTIDNLAAARDLSGVFCYDVAEPFGTEIAQMLLGETFTLRAADAAALRLIEECAS